MNRQALERAAREGDPVAMARILVSIPSMNPALEPDGPGEGAVAARCAAWLEAWGFRVEVSDAAPGRPNVVATLTGGGPTLLLNGHTDTVGVQGMTVPPFDAAVRDGRLLGRGSCDMKGGLASLLAAASRLARTTPRPSVVVALTADEEHASLGMAALVEAGVEADMAVVCEPTSLAVMPAHKGFVWLEAIFHGRAAHGSRPGEGVDAIRHAGRFLAALDAYEAALNARPPHPLLGHGSVHAGTIQGGEADSVYPALCRLTLERRTLPGERGPEVEAEFGQLLETVRERHPGLRADLRLTLERPGTDVSADAPVVERLLAACASEGVEPRLAGMTAWVDAAFLNEAGIPAVCFGPGDIGQAHTADEWVDIEQIRRCAGVLTRLGAELAAS